MFDLTTGVVKKPRSVTEFVIPDRVIGLVNQWGKIYQKEERENKNRWKEMRATAMGGRGAGTAPTAATPTTTAAAAAECDQRHQRTDASKSDA